MKVFVIESELNKEIVEHISKKYIIQNNINKLYECGAVIVGRVKNIKLALEIIDVVLQLGIDVICVKENVNNFVCNLLIKEGAIYI